MEIPKIGGANGIFEIFVPGTFLVINLIGGVFVLSFPKLKTFNPIDLELIKILLNPISIIVFLICFGYLTGMILRLLRPEKPDKKSKTKHAKIYKHLDKSMYTSEFPYISWFNHLFKTKSYPEKSKRIFDELWLPGEKNIQGKQFFNFYKLIICYNDSKAANEIFSAESITRYITGIFYALRISIFYFSAIIILLLMDSFFHLYWFYNGMQISIIIVLIAILTIYYIALQRIITNFRTIRIKEVESVILGSINNYQLILSKLNGK